MAVTGLGAVHLVFSGSNANAFISAYGYTLGDAAPVLLHRGEGAFNETDRAGRRRWGDYSFTSVDPVDDMTVWTTQEFADNVPKPYQRFLDGAYGTYFAPFASDRPTLTFPVLRVKLGSTNIRVGLNGTGLYYN